MYRSSNAIITYQPKSLPSPLESSRAGSFAQRFIIPTKTDSLSSGFPYHPRLHEMNVSLDEWHLFTSDIVNAGKLTAKEDYAAWSTGIATGTLTSAFLLVFGPLVGYAAGKTVHKKVVVSKVKERLLKDGDMRSVLRRWNELTFAAKGFQAWLDLPIDHDVNLEPGVKEKKTKDVKKAEKKENRRFKIVIIPESDKQGFTWSDTGSPAQTSTPTPVVPFVEAPQADHKSLVELQPGSSDNIQPLVNHEQESLPDGSRDRKYEYRPVPPDIRPDHDTRPLEESAADGSLSPSSVVTDGRIPESEIIPEDEKKDKHLYEYPEAFEMDGGEAPSASKS